VGKKGPVVTTNRAWQELYAAAMLELDFASLQGRIEVAQAVIRQAMEERASAREGAAEEMQAMSAALGNLQALQRVALKGSKPAGSGPASDGGVSYATHVPQDSCGAHLAQAAVGDDGTASSRQSRDRSQQAGLPECRSSEA
jgi:hypothetical protein